MGTAKSSPTVRWATRRELQPLMWSVRIDVILMSNVICRVAFDEIQPVFPGISGVQLSTTFWPEAKT
jgi:hypothetical protein